MHGSEYPHPCIRLFQASRLEKVVQPALVSSKNDFGRKIRRGQEEKRKVEPGRLWGSNPGGSGYYPGKDQHFRRVRERTLCANGLTLRKRQEKYL
jgi:hypothetical protein